MKPALVLTEGAWRACWGHYSVFLVRRDEWWRWAVQPDGEAPHVGSFAYDSAPEAAARAGQQLERYGCQVFVDGQRQELAKFLAFEPIDPAEVAFIP